MNEWKPIPPCNIIITIITNTKFDKKKTIKQNEKQ